MPPSIIDQIRAQQAWEQPKKSSSVGFIVGTIAAFGAGVIGVVAWGGLPALSIKGLTAGQPKAVAAVTHLTPSAPVAAAKQPDISIPTRGRLGNAVESKLLRSCMPAEMNAASMAGMDNKALYNLLQTTNQMMSIAAVAGAQDIATGAKSFSMMWAEVADCVFRQNGYVLCEPDNRALAVEAVNAFIKQSALAAAPERDSELTKATATRNPRGKLALEQAMYKVRATRERVLDTLKVRAQEGRFIASDFGFFAPSEVTQAVKSAKPTADACANKS
jgi:hypothetical protein